MVSINDILQVDKIDGVKEYILVDDKGQIISHDIKHPEKMAKLVCVCLQNSLAIAKIKLKFLFFARKTKNNIYVFPVGKCGLGVVKHQSMSDMIFAEKIIHFLNNLISESN